MKLTDDDKKILMDLRYFEEDLSQIEKATRRTVYTISRSGRKEENIPCLKAVELLGRETFLSGIARSAFHMTSVRDIENTNDKIYFDSEKLFK